MLEPSDQTRVPFLQIESTPSFVSPNWKILFSVQMYCPFSIFRLLNKALDEITGSHDALFRGCANEHWLFALASETKLAMDTNVAIVLDVFIVGNEIIVRLK